MQCNIRSRLGAALAVLTVCALVRPAGADVFVDVSVAEKQDGKYGQQVSIKPGDKVFFRISAMNTYRRPLVAICDIPMLKYQDKGLLLPGQIESMTLVAECLAPGAFKPAACILFVDPTTGCASEVDDSCLVVCAKKGDDLRYEIGGDQQQGNLGKGGGQQQAGGQQQGGQQQLGAQQQSGGQQPGLSDPVFSLVSSQQQSGSGNGESSQQGGSKNHGQDKKGDSGSKGHGKKGKNGGN